MKFLRRMAIAAFLFLALSAGVASATEFLVNTITVGNQKLPTIAALAGGGFVIAWQDESQSGDDSSLGAIRAQQFDSKGLAQGPEFLVNTTTLLDQSSPDVAALAGGGFVIAWEGESMTAGDTSGYAVRAQRFDASGVAQGPEFLVNTTTAGDQQIPIIASLSSGGFVIAWEDQSMTAGDTSSYAVRAQRFDASGVAQGPEFLVNTTTLGSQAVSSVAGLAGGGFVIAWEDQSMTAGDTNGYAVRAQRYTASGARLGAEFLVNTITLNNQFEPGVAALTGGGFVITWTDASASSGDFDSYAIRAQRYDASGATQGGEFLVNTKTAGDQSRPSVAALSGGGFVVTWEDDEGNGNDTSLDAIVAQRYDATGAAHGLEFLVNTTTLQGQIYAKVAALFGGDFVIVWQDSSQSPDDPDGTAIRADIVAVPTTLFSSVLPSARSVAFGGAADAPGISRPAAAGDPVTVFASVINAGASLAQNCVISVPAASPVTLSYQQTDAANVPIGPVDAPFDIVGGQSRSFILSFTPVATNPGKDVFPDFSCEDANVDAIPGVNTVFLTIRAQAGPDVLSIGATASGDGIINIPAGGIGLMTTAATNIGIGDAGGSSDAAVSVSVDTGAASPPVLLLLCETDAAGACFDPPGGGPVDSVIGTGPSFFAVFVFDQASGGIALDPANARVFVRFKDAGGNNLSVTSGAITVPAASNAPDKATSP